MIQLSDGFKKAIYTIATSLVVWFVQDHVAEGRKRDARLVAIEGRLNQLDFENRYYHGSPIVPPPPAREPEKK